MPLLVKDSESARRVAEALRQLAEQMERLAREAGEESREHPELEEIAKHLEAAAEALAQGLGGPHVSGEHRGRMADSFEGVGRALRSR